MSRSLVGSSSSSTFGPPIKQPHKAQPAALAAGKVGHQRACLRAAKAEAVAQQRSSELAPVAKHGVAAHLLQGLQHAQVSRDLGRVLGEMCQLHRLAALHPAFRWLELAGE